jgi:hypothetical protein
MTYIYHVLKDNPVGLWPLDGTVADFSGYDRDGATTGTPTADRPLAARGISAQYLDAAGFTYPVSDFMQTTKQNKPFTLEAWIKPHNSTGDGNIVMRDSSGLFIDEGYLFFQVASSTEIVKVEYDWLKVGEVAHVVGVYDTNDIYLYVNGEIVGSATIADSIRTSGFVDTSTNLKTNAAAGYKFTVDSVAVYNYALSGRTVQSHYFVGTQYPSVSDISASNGGNIYILASDRASLKASFDISGGDWLDAAYSNMVVDGDSLVNVIDQEAGDYAAAVWEKAFPLTEEALSLAGSSLEWQGTPDVTVSVAIDGGAYSVISNGGQPFGTLDITAGVTLKVKVEMPGGSDQSVMREMRFRAYYSKAIVGTNADVLMTITNPDNVKLDTVDHNPAEFSDNGGAQLSTNAALAIAPDANFGGYTAVEFTFFQPASQNSKTIFTSGAPSSIPTITTNGTGQWVPTNLTALIVDGVVVSTATTITPGRWHHVIAIFASQTTALTFANAMDARIGYIAVYPSGMSAMTTAGAQQIYKNWVGAAALQTIDDDVINLHEYNFPDSGTPARGYTYDWQIQPAG